MSRTCSVDFDTNCRSELSRRDAAVVSIVLTEKKVAAQITRGALNRYVFAGCAIRAATCTRVFTVATMRVRDARSNLLRLVDRCVGRAPSRALVVARHIVASTHVIGRTCRRSTLTGNAFLSAKKTLSRIARRCGTIGAAAI